MPIFKYEYFEMMIKKKILLLWSIVETIKF